MTYKEARIPYEIVRKGVKLGDNAIPFLKWNYINTYRLKTFKDKVKQSIPRRHHEAPLKDEIETLSSIIPEKDASEQKLKEFISRFIPYSFILYAKIKLTAPYFSSDDDDFYLIQNPCLKEKVFKVPMVRGSGWKGVIAKAGKELINNDMKYFEPYIRVFGTGSSEYRELIDNLSKDKDIKDKLIKYTLFELGIKLKKEDIEQINSNPKGYLKKLLSSKTDINNLSNTPYLQPHKGRAVFYPTYFGSFSLEIINPHSRKTRAGTNPIHYEVVPENEEGFLQIVYIPFDGILTKTDELKKQVEQDIKFLTQAIEKTADIGIGAKEKLGWGRFELGNEIIKCNK